MPDLPTPFSPEGERVYEQGVKRWEEGVDSVDRVCVDRVWKGYGGVRRLPDIVGGRLAGLDHALLA